MNVRSNVVFVLLVAMLGGLLVLAVTRDRTRHLAPAFHPEVVADAGGPRADAHAAAEAGVEAGGAHEAKDAGSKLGRAMRVVAVGWEVLAPGIVANAGRNPGEGSAFTAAGLEVHLRESDDMSDVESQLARGGADENGADVAIVPLPAFAASFERLRALEPEVFLVVGWSRGHEAILGGKGASLGKAKTGEEVRVATGHGDAATGFSLLALDLAGMPPPRLRLVNDPKGADFAAVTRPFALETARDAPNKLLLSTADATQAVPLVAVAPHGLVEAHGDALEAWSKVWLDGVSRLHKDVPAAARLVAQEAGAPEAAALLERLGLADLATVRANARALGLAGRSAVTIPALFQRYLRLWREAGAVTVPAPETPPVTTLVLAALARRESSSGGPGSEPSASGGSNGSVLLAQRFADPKVDEATLVEAIGFLAGIFDRATIRVSTRAPALGKAAVESAYGRYDVAQGRVVSGTTPTAGASALLEVIGGS